MFHATGRRPAFWFGEGIVVHRVHMGRPELAGTNSDADSPEQPSPPTVSVAVTNSGFSCAGGNGARPGLPERGTGHVPDSAPDVGGLRQDSTLDAGASAIVTIELDSELTDRAGQQQSDGIEDVETGVDRTERRPTRTHRMWARLTRSTRPSRRPDMPEVVHAFTADAMGDHDAVGIAELIRDGTVHPKEVVAAAIARSHGPLNRRSTRSSASDSNRHLPMPTIKAAASSGGIPMFFKDMVDVAGMPTHNGSAAFEHTRIRTKSDPIVEQILAQGFINLGKSTMPEFGFTCSTGSHVPTDPTRPTPGTAGTPRAGHPAAQAHSSLRAWCPSRTQPTVADRTLYSRSMLRGCRPESNERPDFIRRPL